MAALCEQLNQAGCTYPGTDLTLRYEVKPHPALHDLLPCVQSPGAARRRTTASTVLAAGAARGPRLAFPWIALQRWWAAWSKAPPPPPLQALISSVAAGCGLHLRILT